MATTDTGNINISRDSVQLDRISRRIGILSPTRHALVKISPEILKPLKRYSVPNPPKRVKVKAQVMQRVKGGGIDFVSHVQVAQIGPGTGSTGHAPALRIERPFVFDITGVLDIDLAFARKQLAVARIAGRQDAVEHIDPPGDRLNQVLRRAHAHEVAGPIIWQ